jgi:hypothetical protein
MDLPTRDDGVRAGDPDHCFYCQASRGEHTAECVCVTRSVVMRLTVDVVPRIWSHEDVLAIEEGLAAQEEDDG